MTRNLNIAFLMDPLEKLDLKGDTTFALAFEAQRRKHTFVTNMDMEIKLMTNSYTNWIYQQT